MFKDIKKKKRELNKESTIEVLKNGREGILSTISENGYPYGIAVNYVYHNNCIYFHCSNSGHKLENISKNNKVSFFVNSDITILPKDFTTHYKSVVIFGHASIVNDKEKRDAIIAIGEKYSHPHMEEGIKYIDKALNAFTVVKIEIDHITGKYSDETN
ncbi:pyridoxamine 5'-phosphate oxidase family protein [Terrisporobacter mayombei]|uniref:MFS transporter n=1 Tax=Terrisporobacter mayombei TaxID=1541 RepID=A0ABY9Q484_9FIRM|nr:pyridoxamine 5'-phosphate oxidase family protein [Terrisporobacter mayombei]MCC3867797.1 pyridoxamine 5'-phosphate oxidase family protein [Terrisporobacter mayombei]WMT82059.1 hypothetical protein TEMA_24120 [Terrisporobacter mayombei]